MRFNCAPHFHYWLDSLWIKYVSHKIKGSSGKKIKTEINSGSNAREKALTIVTLTTQKFTFIYIFSLRLC